MGWTGDTCGDNIDECEELAPCKDGSTCTVSLKCIRRAESQSGLTHRPSIPPPLNWKPFYFVFQDKGNIQEMFFTRVYPTFYIVFRQLISHTSFWVRPLWFSATCIPVTLCSLPTELLIIRLFNYTRIYMYVFRAFYRMLGNRAIL